ncbi:LYR motif-containing protein 4A-like [Eucyclogobius newberryi]|uniref:LYR motif-containing protein 4A-like n=1 Tax=Eucyclogobius newberryi TaxID=166745 RepID=UPI003B5CE9BC
MAAPARSQAISLYKMLLRESGKFPSYNYRTYALRRVRDAFRENQTVQDPELIHSLLQEGTRNLQVLQRQVAVGQLYTSQKLVVE